jgi:hypothetical protein
VIEHAAILVNWVDSKRVRRRTVIGDSHFSYRRGWEASEILACRGGPIDPLKSREPFCPAADLTDEEFDNDGGASRGALYFQITLTHSY